ncbi:MAG: glucose-6-phosphate isomerase [Planctomycetaceae bacterium]|nr:glucose-6-phosphate isomerase [Planctomycetaceae bacterium]
MTAANDLWTRFCDLMIVDRELGFTLDVSRVRFTAAEVAPLWPKLQTALEAMRELEAGAVANPDEKRMVGHYWLRAPELAPSAELTKDIRDTQAAVAHFASQVHTGVIQGQQGKIEHVLHVGIGGSALGPQFVAQALGATNDPLKMWFIDNADPDGIDGVLAQLEGQLGRTLVVVVSKSGGTPETRNGMLEIQAAYKAAGVDFARHAVAVTSTGSALFKTAQAESWMQMFPMWDWVGGRTSVLSAVGLLPAALQGMNTTDLLAGAAAMDRLTRKSDPKQNPAAMLAAMWHHVGQGKGLKDMVILPYKDRLALFSKYLQQLVMESLGKEFDRQGRVVEQGIAVYGNKGSTDQHAYVQQLRDGIPNFFATFIQVLRDRNAPSIAVNPGITTGDYLQGFLLGTRQALSEKNRDSITITVEEVNGRTVGALIALYERAVGLYAELVDINAYHQPGVEAGKKAAAEVLDVQTKLVAALKATGSPQTASQLAAAMGQPDRVETVYQILRHLAANPDRGVTKVTDGTPGSETYRAS